MLHPIKVPKLSNPGNELIGAFGIADKTSVYLGTGTIICRRSEVSAINRQNLFVPARMILSYGILSHEMFAMM